MQKKTVLITGANKGIGLETGLQLGRLGFTVLIGARDSTRGRKAVDELVEKGIDAHLVEINPTDTTSVKQSVVDIEKKFKGLDVLINNAGTLLPDDLQSPSRVPVEILRSTYEINVFGLHQVTSSFWPLLNRSKEARIVNVSSLLGSLTSHSNGRLGDFKALAYDSSKAAVNMMTTHYAYQWQGTPHKVNAIHPGSVKTDLNPEGELTVEEGAKTSVRLATIGENGPNGKFFYFEEELPW